MTQYMKDIKLYNENIAYPSCDIIHTKILIGYIEELMKKILDKHSEICKYYIEFNNNYFGVSFNVGIDQFEAMCKTMFEIHVFKNIDGKAILLISKEITEHEQWGVVHSDLLRAFK